MTGGVEKIGNERRDGGSRGSSITCLIKDIDYNGVSKWKGKRKKEKIVHNMY